MNPETRGPSEIERTHGRAPYCPACFRYVLTLEGTACPACGTALPPARFVFVGGRAHGKTAEGEAAIEAAEAAGMVVARASADEAAPRRARSTKEKAGPGQGGAWF